MSSSKGANLTRSSHACPLSFSQLQNVFSTLLVSPSIFEGTGAKWLACLFSCFYLPPLVAPFLCLRQWCNGMPFNIGTGRCTDPYTIHKMNPKISSRNPQCQNHCAPVVLAFGVPCSRTIDPLLVYRQKTSGNKELAFSEACLQPQKVENHRFKS